VAPNDRECLGLLVRAVAERSAGGYVLIRCGRRAPRPARVWRVNVRTVDGERTTSGVTLAAALERALVGLGAAPHHQWVACACPRHPAPA
jgi:hypothetical protein